MKKKLIFILIVGAILIFLSLNFLNVLPRFKFNGLKYDENTDSFSCYAYDNVSGKILLSVIIKNMNGIKSVKFPDGDFIINGNNKTKIYFDYEFKEGIDNTFTIITTNGEESQYTITDENIQNSIPVTVR